MRIIDADALRAELEHYDKDEHLMWCELDMYKVVDAQPTIERPHGEWIENYDKTDGFTWLTCTRCMCKAYEEGYNFCPNCGADMRGGRE